MFSAFPHWDLRIGHGQRSGAGQWSAVVFLSMNRVLRGSEARHLHPLPITIGGSSGTMSINADVLPQYIEKVVACVPTIYGASGEAVALGGGRVGPLSGTRLSRDPHPQRIVGATPRRLRVRTLLRRTTSSSSSM